MSDEYELEIPVTETERKKAEVLQQVYGVESFDELVSEMLEEQFGDIHPDALTEDGVDTDALMAGDLDPADVPAKYKIGNYDAGETEVSGDV